MMPQVEIETELRRLEALIPKLVADCDPDEVLEAFAAEAARLTEHAHVDDVAHIRSRISCMLSSAGLIPGENEGEPCTDSDS